MNDEFEEGYSLKTELIIHFIKQHKLSVAQFCGICNIDLQLYKHIFKKGKIQSRHYRRIADVLCIQPYKLFDDFQSQSGTK